MIIVFICMAKGVKLSVSGGFETLGMHDIVIVRSSEGSARPEGAEEIVLMKPVALHALARAKYVTGTSDILCRSSKALVRLNPRSSSRIKDGWKEYHVIKLLSSC